MRWATPLGLLAPILLFILLMGIVSADLVIYDTSMFKTEKDTRAYWVIGGNLVTWATLVGYDDSWFSVWDAYLLRATWSGYFAVRSPQYFDRLLVGWSIHRNGDDYEWTAEIAFAGGNLYVTSLAVLWEKALKDYFDTHTDPATIKSDYKYTPWLWDDIPSSFQVNLTVAIISYDVTIETFKTQVTVSCWGYWRGDDIDGEIDPFVGGLIDVPWDINPNLYSYDVTYKYPVWVPNTGFTIDPYYTTWITASYTNFYISGIVTNWDGYTEIYLYDRQDFDVLNESTSNYFDVTISSTGYGGYIHGPFTFAWGTGSNLTLTYLGNKKAQISEVEEDYRVSVKYPVLKLIGNVSSVQTVDVYCTDNVELWVVGNSTEFSYSKSITAPGGSFDVSISEPDLYNVYLTNGSVILTNTSFLAVDKIGFFTVSAEKIESNMFKVTLHYTLLDAPANFKFLIDTPNKEFYKTPTEKSGAWTVQFTVEGSSSIGVFVYYKDTLYYQEFVTADVSADVETGRDAFAVVYMTLAGSFGVPYQIIVVAVALVLGWILSDLGGSSIIVGGALIMGFVICGNYILALIGILLLVLWRDADGL